MRATNPEGTGDWSASGTGPTRVIYVVIESLPECCRRWSRYLTGEDIDISVIFTENVTVTGTPHLTLTIGSETRMANFVTPDPDEGPRSFNYFSYTVQASDRDADGISIVGNKLSLNGGTILDEGGIQPVLAITLYNDHTNDREQMVGGDADFVQPEKPAAPTVVVPVSSGHTTLSVSWTAPVNNGPAITDYDLRYRISGETDWTDAASVSGSATSTTLSGLQPGTTYQIQVRAQNRRGESPWSDSGTRKNLGLVFSPMSLEVTEGGSSTSYTVALATQPTGTVTMTITSDDVGAVTATPSPLTFDATNWSTAKTVTVNSVVDSDTEHEEVVINHEASGGGYNEVTGTIETAVTDVTVPGAWSYETVVEPSTITAGGGVAATTTLRAKFQADQGNLSSLSARVTTGGKLFVQLYNTQLPHIGWATAADSYDDATALKVETTSDPPDRTADVSAGTLVCETTFDGEVLYAKSTANSGDNNVRLGVDTNFTYTAVVNGMDSTISVASGRSALAGVLVVLSMPLTTDLAATAGDTEVVLSWPDPSDSSIIKYQLLQLQEAKLTASDGAASDNFGYSVAVAGDTAVVGAYGDGSQSGSAYVFTRGGSGVWSQTAKLTAADGAANDQFGYSVAVAGAYEDDDRGGASGSAYVFVKPAAGWATGTQTAKLTASDGTTTDYFGISVAVDGDTAVVGAHFDDDNGSKSGSAYAFGIQNWTDIRGSGAATTSHTVSGLTNGTEYTFRIRAVNASGNGEASDSVDTTPAGPPLAPADFTATGGDMSATLEWEAVDANGSPITKYQYQQKEDAGSVANWTDIPGSGAATTSHTVTGLTAGIVYTFRLRAVNGVGEGAESDEQTVTLPLAKPAGLTATAGHLQVTLAWNDPSDTTITGYQSQQTTATTTDAGSTVGDFSGLGWTDILDANAGTTSHIVTGLTNRVTYYFKVRAGNPSGPGGATMYSAGSDPASATAALGPPNVPGRLTAKPGNGMVVLSWDDPDDSTIIRYEYRQADTYQTGDPVWPTDPTDNSEVWTRITASGADTTTHTVTGLDNDRTNQGDEDDVLYTFQVRAVNYAINRITWQLGVASDAVKANPGLPIDGPTGLTGSFDPETGKIVLEWDQHADYPGAEFAVNWHYNRVQAQRTGSFDGGFLVGPAVTDADGNAILPQRPATGTEVDIGAEFGVYDFVVAARSNFGPWSLTAATTSVTTSPFLDQPDATREVDKQAGAGSSVGKPVETRTPSGYDVRLSIDAPNGDFAIDSATGQITVTGGSRAPGAYPVAVTATVTDTLSPGTSAKTYSINLTINVTSRGPWTQQGKLTASDGVAEDSLGYAVAVDEASGTIVVGAKDHNGRVGAVYVYDGYDDDTPAKLTSPTTNAGEQFGYTVAIDGDTIVVGSTEADTTPGSGFPPTPVRNQAGHGLRVHEGC